MHPERQRRRGFGLALLLFAAFRARGAPPPALQVPFEGRLLFRTYGGEEGLSNPNPEVLLQDRAGLLWAGTPDGLFRFDGRRIVRFGTDDGLSSARITALHETRDGRLYAGTRAGLARFDGLVFLPLGKVAGLPEAPVLGIASDASGTLFVATPRGLFLSIGEIFHVEARKDGQPERPVTALQVDREGALFFAREGRLFRKAGALPEDFGAAKGLPALERIDGLLADGAGRLWVKGPADLFVLPKGGERFLPAGADVPLSTGSGSLALDARGELLVPTWRGLAVREGESFRLLTRRDGLETEAVLSALADREGSLWLGLSGVGLARRLGSGSFTAYTTAEGLPPGSVRAVAHAKDGALWAGTAEGLVRLPPGGGAPRVFRSADGLGGDAVLALAAGEDGSVWAGSWPGGVTRFGPEPGRLERYGAEGLAPSEFLVLALKILPDGSVWAGAWSGAWRLDPGAKPKLFRRAPVPGGEEPDPVFALAEDGKGGLWGATRLGLLRLLPAPRRFGKRNGLRSDHLTSLSPDGAGGLVVAYADGGLDRVSFEGDRLMSGPFEPGKQKERKAVHARFVGRDAAGAFWVGAQGVLVFRPDAAEPLRYGRENGLVAEETVQNAFLAEPSGGVLFGTSRGLVRFRPGLEAAARPLPSVAISGAWAGERPLRPDRPALLLSKERSLRVTWGGPSFAEARRLRYRIRLTGPREVVSETPDAEALVLGLAPGDYRLEITALLPSGVMREKRALFTFRVEAAWWETVAARAAGLLLLLAGVAALIAWRTRALRADLARLREKADRQAFQLEVKGRELGEASLSDPLTGIRNRRFLFATISSDLERAVRAYAPFATPAERRLGDVVFYFVAIDGLAEVNARWGIEAGDEVVVEAVRRLKGVVRSSDLLVRWGGETFLVVTRSSGREQAHVLSERILAAIAGAAYVVKGREAVTPGCNVGWVPFPWVTEVPAEVTFEEALHLAERALDAARELGRIHAVGVLATGPRAEDAAEAKRAGGSLLAADGRTVKLVISECNEWGRS